MMAYSRHAAVLLVGLALLVFSTVICGCGGGRISSPVSELRGAPDAMAMRSVQLNSYNTWGPPRPSSSEYDMRVQCLAMRNRIVMPEKFSVLSNLTPQMLRQMNPRAKVYRLYDLCCKNSWDSDWIDYSSLGDRFVQTPILYQDIVANDWWLRDGNGDIVKENERTWFLDVGKPGVKEMLLKNILARVEGKGFDGIVLDYHGADGGLFDKWITGKGLPNPVQYSGEADWFYKAVKPMLLHVAGGLRSRGYEIIANCAGEYYSPHSESQWLRSLIDGSVYELWALNSDTEWASQRIVELRINSFLDDPLEAWTADYGLRGPEGLGEQGSDPEYYRKFTVSLAMYYIGLPQSADLRARRFFNRYGNMEADWESLWDFYIGDPSALPEKRSGKYFWSRKYTQGLVLLNYEHSEAITYPLDRAYRTPKGTALTKSVTVKPHTALILAAQ